MSKYELRDNSGSSFKSDRKTKESQPDLTGKCMVGGKVYYVSTWRKLGRSGEEWLSHSFKLAEEVPARTSPRPKPLPDPFVESDLPQLVTDDGIPF